MSYASANGSRIVSGSVMVPNYGAWVADLKFADASPLTGPIALTIGDLTLKGAIVRTDTFAGLREARLVGGAGGWRQQIPVQAYQNPSGVPLATVLGDAAMAVGETLSLGANPNVGTAWTREAAPAERQLRQLTSLWWIDPAGVTQVRDRPASPITSAFTVIHYDPAKGQFEIATETLADWMPGRTFSSPLVPAVQTISMTRYEFEDDGVMRLHILVAQPSDNDRLFDAMQRIIRSEQPTQTFLGTYEYIVQATDGTTVDASPSDTTIGLPGIAQVPIRTGIAGASCKPQNGSRLGVGFFNGNPSRPFVACGFDNTSAQSVTFDAGTGTSEHYATTEAVVGILMNFLLFLSDPSIGDPSTWRGVGKILDPTDPNLTLLLTKVTVWWTAASNVVPFNATTGGGTYLPLYAALLQSLIASKAPDLGFPVLSPGLGCPNVSGG